MAIVDRLAYGRAWILTVDADPSGVTAAPVGSFACLNVAPGTIWRNTDGAAAWVVLGGGTNGNISGRNWSGAAAITTASVATGGGTQSGNVTGWFNYGIVAGIQIVASSNTINANFALWADAAHTKRMYYVEGFNAFTSAWVDGSSYWIRDDDGSAALHYTVTNNGANASTFVLTLQGMGA